MNKIKLAFALLVIIVLGARAEGPSLTLKSVLAGQSVDQTSGVIYDSDPTLETEATLSWENGLYLTAWHGGVLESGAEDSFGNSLEGYIGYAGSLDAYDYDVCVGYISAPDLFTAGIDDNLYTYVQVGREISKVSDQLRKMTGQEEISISAFTRWEHYETLYDTDYEGGNLYTVGFEGVAIDNEIATVDSSVNFTYDDGVFGEDNGWLFKYSVGCNIHCTEIVDVIVSGDLFVPIEGINDRDAVAVGKLGLQVEL